MRTSACTCARKITLKFTVPLVHEFTPFAELLFIIIHTTKRVKIGERRIILYEPMRSRQKWIIPEL